MADDSDRRGSRDDRRDAGGADGGAPDGFDGGSPHVSTADVRDAAAGALGAAVASVEPVAHGTNAVYEVALRDGPVDAAVCKVGTRTPDRIPVEAAAIERVDARTAIPVPTVLDVADGTANPTSAPYLLVEHVPGRSPTPRDVDPPTFERVCYEAGRNLGSLHESIPVDGVGPLESTGDGLAAPAGSDEWPALYRRVVRSQLDDLERVEAVPASIDELRPAIEAYVDRAVEALEGLSFDPAVVHMDYRLENLRLRGDGPPVTAAVLDWGGVAGAPPAYELVHTEAVLFDRAGIDAGLRERARERFREGYAETAGPLDGRPHERWYRLPARVRLLKNVEAEMRGRSAEALEARASEHVRAVRRLVDRETFR